MKMETESKATPARMEGRTAPFGGSEANAACWNTRLGWLLAVAGFAVAVWLDPASLSLSNAELPAFASRVAIRQAQTAILSMAFLQLAIGTLCLQARLGGQAARNAVWLTIMGAALYAGGHAVAVTLPTGMNFVVCGAAFNLIGCLLLTRGATGLSARFARFVLLTFAFGCFLNVVTGLFALQPFGLRLDFLGATDGVRMRMLRLAQVAAIALPLLTLLYESPASDSRDQAAWTRWGRAGMIGGMIGMPAVLTLAAFTSVNLKYLLPLPALSVFTATIAGASLARRQASRLEFWGWTLIALSMGVGLCMGLYAFNGPFPSPHFVGAYNDFPRRLSRMGHAYCILFGLLSIYIARRQDISGALRAGLSGVLPSRSGTRLLVMGMITTLAGIVLAACKAVPPSWLSVGPALICVATLLCLQQTRQTK